MTDSNNTNEQNQKNPPTAYDSPWKDILQTYFKEFMQFFFPAAHNQIDWTKEITFLDKELEEVTKDAEIGRRLADKLVKLYLKNGQEELLLVHVEVQAQEEQEFSARMYTYNYRIYDKYKKPVMSIAVLADSNPNWCPSQFGYSLYGCTLNFQFPTVKLIDYQQRLTELENDTNPFATVVMAHLAALNTTSDRNERKVQKLALVRRLYEQGFEKQDILNLFAFIDWMLTLPPNLEAEFNIEVQQLEARRPMRYVTSIERDARKEGKEEGKKEGQKEALIKGISLGLRLKFGDSGQDLLPEIEAILDVDTLEAILEAIGTTATVNELRQTYQPTIE
jgi:predicted transposase/invertase (TIGR01784 family)